AVAPPLALALFAALGGALTGCGDDGDAPSSAAGAAGASGQSGASLPKLGELAAGQINIIRPGGGSICGRGGEYAFFVIPADPKKVIIEFEGGGACWDERTCAFAGATFKEDVDPADYTGGRASVGWYDHARPGHPMPDWTHIYIPYCTGDVHWGDNVKTYGAGAGAVTIQHKGAVNARAALDWAYAQIEAPEKVFVTGCSAGGYGSIWWAPQVQSHYPASKVYHFADSAAGVITDGFFQQSFPAWNAQATFPAFVGDFARATALPQLYALIAAHYPQNVYSQYNTVLDENQTFFYTAMGGTGLAQGWSAKMKANVGATQASSPQFRSFVAGGRQHCILPHDNFFTVEAGGTKLTTWLADMVADKPLANAACEGCAPTPPALRARRAAGTRRPPPERAAPRAPAR
ncbi:MAG TPA: pectin acetylesterase-family hydrolase, partial [Polyangiaceae bacterium]|nr:pectin acetylesterase-family hydrolase [Polyangiaceae bacterium]